MTLYYKISYGFDSSFNALLFHKEDTLLPHSITKEQTSPDNGKNKKSKLLCKTCLNSITDLSQKAYIDNKHIHEKINPQGLIFKIGCFSSAPGCISNSAPSTFFSWFSGYSWQHQACSECSQPMGWLFQSTNHSFFGIIIDNIIEDEEYTS